MLILGVDPGATGALAFLDTDLAALVVHDMPTATVKRANLRTRRRLVSEAWLVDLVRTFQPDCAWIEQVHAMPGQGVASSFSFGLSYGVIRGVLAGLSVPFSLVTPNEWKRSFRLSSDKSEARLTAARLFPGNAQFFTRSRDDGRAEAALLALFGAQQQVL